MELKIDQIAIAPDPSRMEEALALLEVLGVKGYVKDQVAATGLVRGEVASNKADLRFNYDFVPGIEFEVLHYVDGKNFVEHHTPCAAHLGVHVTQEELVDIQATFRSIGIPVLQEVFTTSHSNPAIAGIRRYHYVIYATRDLLGLDLKFINRLEDNRDGD